MKIGINTLFLIPGEVGGSETYLMEILREWKNRKIPHEVVLFTQLENDAYFREAFADADWSFVCCPFKAENRFVRILREQLELPVKVKKSGVDVLWSPGYTAPFFCGCPQVVSILDMQYKRFPQDLSFVGRWTTEVLVKLAARRAKKILTISEFSKNEIIRFTRANPEKISVTPLAADAVFADTVDEQFMQAPYILCVSNTYPHKNVDQLVRAFVAVEKKIPHQLVLVGRPRLGEPAVEEALKGLKDSGRFSRLSGLTRKQLAGLYQQADLFVFPSLYEGFGLPVLEAMTAGVPILTTRAGSIPEVGGDFVQYVAGDSDADWEAALVHAVKAEADRETARKDWLAQFTWSLCAEQTLRGLSGES